MAATGIIGRKLAASHAVVAEGGPGADRGWRLALARAARDQLKLPLEVAGMMLSSVSQAEVLEALPQPALILVLDGPGEGIGVIALSAEVLQSVVEVQTIGRVSDAAAGTRRPTRTDAAMVAPVVEAALTDLEQALEQEADLVWAGGWRFASFLEDPRPLGLLLEDAPHRLLMAEVSLGHGARTGQVMLALPAEGRGKMPARQSPPVQDPHAGPLFTQALAERLEEARCQLDAVLSRVSMPLNRVMGLQVGDVLALPTAALDKVSCEGLDARRLAEGKLGQNRGMRALRLGGVAVQLVQGASTADAPALRQSA